MGRRFLIAATVASSACFASWGADEAETLRAARSAVKEWVAVESAISREEAAWAQKEILLQDLIAVAEKRIQQLDTELEQNDDQLTDAESERAAIVQRADALDWQAARIESFVADLERKLQALQATLPPPLLDELATLSQRLPQDPARSARPLGERMQNALVFMDKIRLFDQGVAVHESLQTLPGRNEPALTRTLYIGLGQAYYLTAGDAGYGRKNADGWEWISQPEISDAVAEAIAAANGSNAEPRLIPLPVQLAEGEAKR